jgi:hypothetical protein
VWAGATDVEGRSASQPLWEQAGPARCEVPVIKEFVTF